MLIQFLLPLFPKTKSKKPRKKPSSPELHKVWCALRSVYFPDRTDIDKYSVEWSTRKQRRVLASCNLSKKRVVVARELKQLQYFPWWEPLLYHEMCHAIIGESVERNRRKRLWHGPQFKELAGRHPLTTALDDWIKEGGWIKAVLEDRVRLKLGQKI